MCKQTLRMRLQCARVSLIFSSGRSRDTASLVSVCICLWPLLHLTTKFSNQFRTTLRLWLRPSFVGRVMLSPQTHWLAVPTSLVFLQLQQKTHLRAFAADLHNWCAIAIDDLARSSQSKRNSVIVSRVLRVFCSFSMQVPRRWSRNAVQTRRNNKRVIVCFFQREMPSNHCAEHVDNV